MLLDESRHAISMFEDDVVLVHKQKMPPPAACGSAADISSIITSLDLSLASSVSAVICKRGRGAESRLTKPRDPGFYIVPSEFCFIQGTLTPWRWCAGLGGRGIQLV